MSASPSLSMPMSFPPSDDHGIESRIPIQLSKTNAMSRAAVAGAKSFDADSSMRKGPFAEVEWSQKAQDTPKKL